MKHLIIFLPLLMSFFSYSQKYSLGVKVAPLITWPSFGDNEAKDKFSRKNAVGFSTGVLIEFPLKKNYSLSAEGGYSKKGRRIFFNNSEWENNSVYHFIDLTMVLRKSYDFQVIKNVPMKWFLNIGPEIDYWLSGKGSIIVQEPGYPYTIIMNEPVTADFTKMYENDINRWLFGLVVGVGVKAPLTRNQHLSCEARFVSGHTYLGKENSSYIEILTFEDTMKTNLKALGVNVSYIIDLDVQKSKKGKSTIKKRKIKTVRKR